MRMTAMRQALEAYDEQPTSSPEDQFEASVAATAADLEATHLLHEVASVGIDGLSEATGMASEIVEDNACSPQTLALLSMLTAPSYSAIKKPMLAVESFSGDIRDKHQAALEGWREDWQNSFQDFVVGFKQSKDFFADLFRNTNEQVTKYENILAEAEAEFKGKRDTHENQYHHASMMQLWYHFMTEKGQAVNLVQVMTKDHAVSEYILTKYPEELFGLLRQITSTINGASLKSTADCIKFGKALEKLKHPADLFDRKYMGGKPYFHVMGLIEKSGNPRRVLTIDGTDFQDLSELATSRVIKEDGSAWHAVKKVGANTVPYVGPIAAALGSKDFSMTDDDIQKVLDFGKGYLKNIKKFLSLEQKVLGAFDDLSSAIERLGSKAQGLDGKDERAARSIIILAEAYAHNVLKCLSSPAVDEVSRSLKSARYCGYISKRMNWNAK